jgi:hypothetical protein
MRGFRGKFILLLIVYFAGFATAIYTLTPVPDSENTVQSEQGTVWSVLKSDQFAQKFSVQLHRCVDFVKEKSEEAGEFIKEKIQQYKENNS